MPRMHVVFLSGKEPHCETHLRIGNSKNLLFYAKGIWRYEQTDNSWTKIGEMMVGRGSFVVLPVEDVTCP